MAGRVANAERVRDGLVRAANRGATMRLNDIEMREADVNKFSALAERPRPAASLSEATSTGASASAS